MGPNETRWKGLSSGSWVMKASVWHPSGEESNLVRCQLIPPSFAFCRLFFFAGCMSKFGGDGIKATHFRRCFASNTGYASAMKTAKKLLHTRYRVNDLERTVKFYREVLGLQEVRRHKSSRGSELVFMKAPESEETIELCYFPGSGPVQVQADLTHLAFEVDSLEEFGKHIAAHGYSYSDGPHLRPDG